MHTAMDNGICNEAFFAAAESMGVRTPSHHSISDEEMKSEAGGKSTSTPSPKVAPKRAQAQRCLAAAFQGQACHSLGQERGSEQEAGPHQRWHEEKGESQEVCRPQAGGKGKTGSLSLSLLLR